ncbi:unnamed protein product [Ambrosiozyma monospora]|uniref:Unnamed protein product n=1 Tax=Ambrosiozyma monospora TaxID=43982 RepID=A0ACB5TNM8_AMBMO|nr:unnamed protein product [Ambrosiozyma monospora]
MDFFTIFSKLPVELKIIQLKAAFTSTSKTNNLKLLLLLAELFVCDLKYDVIFSRPMCCLILQAHIKVYGEEHLCQFIMDEKELLFFTRKYFRVGKLHLLAETEYTTSCFERKVLRKLLKYQPEVLELSSLKFNTFNTCWNKSFFSRVKKLKYIQYDDLFVCLNWFPRLEIAHVRCRTINFSILRSLADAYKELELTFDETHLDANMVAFLKQYPKKIKFRLFSHSLLFDSDNFEAVINQLAAQRYGRFRSYEVSTEIPSLSKLLELREFKICAKFVLNTRFTNNSIKVLEINSDDISNTTFSEMPNLEVPLTHTKARRSFYHVL